MHFSSMIKTVHQAGIWATGTQVKQVIPSLEGFEKSKNPLSQLWVPICITIPKVSKACSEFINFLAKETAQHANVGELLTVLQL